MAPGGQLSVAAVVALQRTAGNAAVTQLLAGRSRADAGAVPRPAKPTPARPRRRLQRIPIPVIVGAGALAYCVAPCMYQSRASAPAGREFVRWWVQTQSSRASYSDELYDAWGHCLLGCCMTDHCGMAVAGLVGGGYEAVREAGSVLLPHRTLRQDIHNELTGIGYGNEHRECSAACIEGLLDGSVDLSAVPAQQRPRRPTATTTPGARPAAGAALSPSP
jgi:hypothetical protein